MHLSSYKDCWLIIGVVSCQRGCLAPLNKNAKASPLLPSSRSKKKHLQIRITFTTLLCISEWYNKILLSYELVVFRTAPIDA